MGRYSGKTCRLSTMLLMTASFFLVEIIVGYVTNSIALVADSFHMLSDVVALIVGFASVRISKWPSKRNTYGWVRAEILGALVNAVFLLALCFSILVEALKRLVEVEKVDSPVLLLIVGGAGLAINVIGLFLFGGHGHSHGGGGGHGHSHGGGGGHGHSHGGGGGGHGHSHSHEKEPLTNGGLHTPSESERLMVSAAASALEKSATDGAGERSNGAAAVAGVVANDKTIIIETPDEAEVYVSPGDSSVAMDIKKPQLASSNQLNMHGVFLHVLGDALGSVVVVVSALVIWFAEGDWKYYVDPAMSVMMVMIILTTTIPLLKESAFILLQTVPSHVDVETIVKELEQMEGIYGVHECHIWQLAGNRIVASAHIRCHGIEEYMTLAAKIKQLFHRAGIHSTTIQPEFIDWQEAINSEQPCALMCESGGLICTTNTCCGDKDLPGAAKALSSSGGALAGSTSCLGGDATDANTNNSALVTAAALNMSGSTASGTFPSAHSLDVKFSPDGDEIVLEMNDLSASVVENRN